MRVPALPILANSNALVSRGDSCCFSITAQGGPGGKLGQIYDGQNRIGDQGAPVGSYCINSQGGITDSNNRGCILSGPTSQFQCDAGISSTLGFSIDYQGTLFLGGSSQFFSCPTESNGGYNIYYQSAPANQQKCAKVTLLADKCQSGNSGSAQPPASSAPAPAPSSSAVFPPASSAPAPAPSSSAVFPPASSAPAPVPSSSVPAPPQNSSAVFPPQSSAPALLPSSAQQAPPSSGASAPLPPCSALYSSGQVPASSGSSVACQQVPQWSTSWSTPSWSTSYGVPSYAASYGTPSYATSHSTPSWATSYSTPSWSTAYSAITVSTSCSTAPAPSLSSSANVPLQSAPSLNVTRAAPPPQPTISRSTTIVASPPTSLRTSTVAPPPQPTTRSTFQSLPSSAPTSRSTPSTVSVQAPPSSVVSAPSSVSSVQAPPSSVQAPSSSVQAPSSSVQAPPSSVASVQPPASSTPKNCPAALTGQYEFPHLILPVDSSKPDTNLGTSYFGEVSQTISTIFNFDIPTSYSGKTCSAVFLFPSKGSLETSNYDFSGSGNVNFALLGPAVKNSTTYNHLPDLTQNFGQRTLTPGGSYNVASFACPTGQTIGVGAFSNGDTYLHWFQDYNPSPIGLYITVC